MMFVILGQSGSYEDAWTEPLYITDTAEKAIKLVELHDRCYKIFKRFSYTLRIDQLRRNVWITGHFNESEQVIFMSYFSRVQRRLKKVSGISKGLLHEYWDYEGVEVI